MNFKKRTKYQIEQSVKSGDLTGGYEFLPWLIYRRLYFLLAIAALLFLGRGVFLDGLNNDDIVYKVCGILSFAAAVIIFIRLRMEWIK